MTWFHFHSSSSMKAVFPYSYCQSHPWTFVNGLNLQRVATLVLDTNELTLQTHANIENYTDYHIIKIQGTIIITYLDNVIHKMLKFTILYELTLRKKLPNICTYDWRTTNNKHGDPSSRNREKQRTLLNSSLDHFQQSHTVFRWMRRTASRNF